MTRTSPLTVSARSSPFTPVARTSPETHDFREFYADYESTPQCLIGRALARQTHVVWSTGGHTMDPVLTFGTGPGAEGLRGLYLNTRLYTLMKQAITGEKTATGR